MMVSKREAKKNRREALKQTWESMTTVAKIRKLYASGRPRKRDQRLSPVTAYGQAGSLLERLQQDMVSQGLDPKDASAVLVVNEMGGEVPATINLEVSRAAMDKTIPKLLAFKNPIPVGVVFCVEDREETDPEKKFKVWVSTFLTDPAALEPLQQMLEEARSGKKTWAS